MKTTLLAAFAMICIMGCNSPETPTATNIVQEEATAEINLNTCQISNMKVHREIYQFWLASFREFTSQHVGAEGGPTLDNTVDNLLVSLNDLNTLQGFCQECENVRVYFAASNSEGNVYTQNLLLVNVASNCNDSAYVDNQILLVTPDSSRFISVEDATGLYENWGSYLDAANEHMPSLLQARAYTFQWQTFADVFGEGTNQESNLHLHYGMHSILPADTVMYGALPTTNGSPEGWMVFNIVADSGSEEGGYAANVHMDFATPCPQFCGKKQFYMAE